MIHWIIAFRMAVFVFFIFILAWAFVLSPKMVAAPTTRTSQRKCLNSSCCNTAFTLVRLFCS